MISLIQEHPPVIGGSIPWGPLPLSPHKVPPGCTQGRLGFLAAPLVFGGLAFDIFMSVVSGLVLVGWLLVLLGTGPSEGR